MTKQVSNSKQTSHTLSENVQKSLEESLEQPITSAYYCGNLAIEDGGKVVNVPTFVVNETYYVYVHDSTSGIFQYETMIERQKRQRKFDEHVQRLMDEYGFSRELGKVIVKAYPTETMRCTNLCFQIQEAKEYISYNMSDWKARFVNEPKQVMLSVIDRYSFNYWLNIRNKQVYNALKNYLFAIN